MRIAINVLRKVKEVFIGPEDRNSRFPDRYVWVPYLAVK